MKEKQERIALFIDADNAPAAKIQGVLAELATHGIVNIRRAYGNWKSPHLKGWEAVLHEFAIRPVQQFALTKGKNATDMAVAIEAVDALYTKQVDIFSIMSSDADYTPLVMHLLSEGKMVIGFGEKKTPSPFVNACSKFLFLENLGTPDRLAKKVVTTKKTGKQMQADPKLMELLRTSVESAAEDDGWAHLASVGSRISNQASFDPRNHGYRKLSELLKAISIFEVRYEEDGGAFVRNRETPTEAA